MDGYCNRQIYQKLLLDDVPFISVSARRAFKSQEIYEYVQHVDT